MAEDTIYTLVPSTNSGRYALNNAEGRDLTSGDSIAINLGGAWITGSIEHGGRLYALEGMRTAQPGYYFIANDGEICGLCVGMRVKLV